MNLLFIPSLLAGDYRTFFIKLSLIAVFWILVFVASFIDLRTGIAASKRIQAGIEIFSKGDVIADGDVYAGGELNAPIVRSSSIINPTGTSAQLLVADGSLLNIIADL